MSSGRFQAEPLNEKEIKAQELLKAVEKAKARREVYRLCRVRLPSFPNPIHVLFLPLTNRAGLTWGAAVEWTNAESLDDAVERYFGFNGKSLERCRLEVED